MNPILQEILRTGFAFAENGQRFEVKDVSIPSERGYFLQQLLSELKPVVGLEVGLAYGVSALFICDALLKTPETRHIVIDPSQQDVWMNVGIHNLRIAGFEDIVEFHNAPSYRVLPKLEAEGRKIDFAFIDGWHTFDFAFVDFFYIDKLLKIGGLVIFDDTDWPSIRKLCEYIATNHPYRPICMSDDAVQNFRRTPEKENISEPVLFGECIAFKKEAEDTRRWDFFHSF